MPQAKVPGCCTTGNLSTVFVNTGKVSIGNLALIALFFKKHKIFSNTACNHVTKLELLLENGAITPPLVSCATHLAKAQIHHVRSKEKNPPEAMFKYKAPPASYAPLCPQGSPGRATRAQLPPLRAPQEQAVMGKLSPLAHPLAPESFSADGDTSHHVRRVLVGGLDA